jgi:prepilin-type processing-associated H-X9-DG protein
MNGKIMKLAVAAVVVAGALAIGVETLRPRKTNQPHAFSAEIRTNMALDLDPKGAIPLRQAQPEDFDVTWDGENGGTLRIMPGSSLRIMAARWNDAKWEEIVSWAHSSLAQLQESTTTSISARQSRFAAILTSEGNLAVMQIGDHDEDKARLQWQVESTALPGYGPVQVVTLACVDPNHPSAQPCAIDFDTGRTVAIPAQALALAPEGFLGWLEQNGIDAIARMTDGNGSLAGVGLVVQRWGPGGWIAAPALAIRDIMTRTSYQTRDPILFREDRYQFARLFKTREGGMGMLQMRGVDPAQQTVQFRYRMVLDDAPAGSESPTQTDAESLELLQSGQCLCDLGRSLLIYANDHEDRLPPSLALRELADSEEQYQWMAENLEYLGAGITCAQSPSLVVAYDKTLLAQGKGTNVLFLDSRVKFVEPEEFAEYGLSDGVEAVRQKNAERDVRDRSQERLDRFGQNLRAYGYHNENRLPASLEEVKEYIGRESRYRWIAENVEYLGAGLLFSQSPSQVVAYDKTLLTQGKGTNVLFLDGHIEFVEPEKLMQLGLPATGKPVTPADTESLILQSATWLCDLGKSLLLYGSEHEDRLPESLALRELAGSEEQYQWLLKDVEYLGAGVTFAQSPSLVVAYDRTLLALGKGTNVLFLDSHIEFVEAERLAALGLPTGSPGSSTPPGK